MPNPLHSALRRVATHVLPETWHRALWRRIVLVRRRRTFRGLDTREAFERIYAENLWGGVPGEFRSGSGSSDEVSGPYVACVRRFIEERGITRVADLGCGDFQVGRRLLAPGLRYVGVDVVRPLIERNEALFGRDGVGFEARDLARDPLPDADLALLRQVLQHLSNAEISLVLKNTEKYPYLLVTEHLPTGTDVRPNLDHPHGPDTRLYDRSGVFLDLPPFSLRTKVLLETQIKPDEVLRTVLVER
jgi:SAM-dependent methyltransferase